MEYEETATGRPQIDVSWFLPSHSLEPPLARRFALHWSELPPRMMAY